ncbi:DMT family transporter [Thalassospira mesophila]|uniref:Membrane protein n=1 Tax=Thalassospira mesophila TaxID=1293891 RepID=A0A1Y2L0F5_9PROT|nr:DMT family transporter [Thalassospira mesophila]OSQ38331.1 membrane protein [Thalassospira mesophila]
MKNSGYIAYVILGLIWGTPFIFTHWAAVYITPAQIVLVRVISGFIPVLLFAIATRALKWRHLRHAHHFLAMAALATALYYLAFAKGTILLLTSVAGMLSGAIPLFSCLCALVFLRSEPLGRQSIGGMLMGFAGVLVIARPWETGLGTVDPMGVLYIVLGSLSLGASFVYARKFISPLGIAPAALCTYQMGLGAIALLLTVDLGGASAIFNDTKAAIGLILGLGAVGTGVAYILYYLIVQKLGAVTAASVTYIPPVVALFIGCALAGEPLHLLDLAATIAILAGVFTMQAGRQRHIKTPSPQKCPV